MAKVFKSAVFFLPMCALLTFAQPGIAANADTRTVAAAATTAAFPSEVGQREQKYCAAHEAAHSLVVRRSCKTKPDWERNGYELILQK